MGKPLFRCAREWCDGGSEEAGDYCSGLTPHPDTPGLFTKPDYELKKSLAEKGDVKVGTTMAWRVKAPGTSSNEGCITPTLHGAIDMNSRSEAQSQEAQKLVGGRGTGKDEVKTFVDEAPPTTKAFVCCFWLKGKCLHLGQHTHGKKLLLHEDVPGLQCGYGERCSLAHHRARLASKSHTSDKLLPEDSSSCRHCSFHLREGMVVSVQCAKGVKFGEVLSIGAGSSGPVQVGYYDDEGEVSESELVPLDLLQLPDFSSISVGMNVQVQCGETKQYYAKVQQISFENGKARAPVLVHYTGYSVDHDEWVGADRLRTKSLRFSQPTLPAQPSDNPTLNVSTPAIATSELQSGALVYVKLDSSMICGEVLEISGSSSKSAAPVKVRYYHEGQFVEKWLSLRRLQVADYSLLEEGMNVQVQCGEKPYFTTVLQISHDARRAKTPVLVHYNGYEEDEWVGADRLRTKSLRFSQPTLPAQPSDNPTLNVSTPAIATSELQSGALVYVKLDSSMICGEVLEISGSSSKSAAPVKVRYYHEGQFVEKWLSLRRLQVADYSLLEEGMNVQVQCGEKPYFTTVLQISHDARRAKTPVLVHYNGYEEDEWVGADRLRTKSLRFSQPTLPAQPSDNPTLNVSTPAIATSELQSGALVYVKLDSSLICGEVLEISGSSSKSAAPVKVRYYHEGQFVEKWLSLRRLQVADYSLLEEGMNVQVQCGEKPYFTTVLQISHDARRAKTPVLVHYNGYASEEDEWVGADRLRTKSLRFSQPTLPSCFQPCADTGRTSTAQAGLEKIPSSIDHAAESSQCHSASRHVALPWDEPEGSDDEDAARGLDLALAAVEATAESPPPSRKKGLEKALQGATGTAHVRKVLAEHGWTGTEFLEAPDLNALKQQLSLAKMNLHESESHASRSDLSDDLVDPLFNDVASSCAAPENQEPELEAELDGQPSNIPTLDKLRLVFSGHV